MSLSKSNSRLIYFCVKYQTSIDVWTNSWYESTLAMNGKVPSSNINNALGRYLARNFVVRLPVTFRSSQIKSTVIKLCTWRSSIMLALSQPLNWWKTTFIPFFPYQFRLNLIAQFYKKVQKLYFWVNLIINAHFSRAILGQFRGRYTKFGHMEFCRQK